ncbi:MAG: hypothetical protein ABSG31_08195 [Tepidisphaeraceae bacterium]|jgi:hypothetical protein
MSHAAPSTHAAGTIKSHGLTARTAIRIAWVAFVLFLILPFLLFLVVVAKLGFTESASIPQDRQWWFLATLGYLLVIVPISFFWRSHVFKAYWTGHTVSPGNYLFGTISVWLALVIGGIFSLTGCLMTNSMLPNLIPALIAFMFFVTLWPSGRAMIGHTGDAEDPSVYKEPS